MIPVGSRVSVAHLRFLPQQECSSSWSVSVCHSITPHDRLFNNKKKKKEDSTRHRHTNGKPSFTFRDDIYIIFFSSTSHIILYNDRIRPQSQSRNRGTKIQKSAGRDGTHTISFALSKHHFVGSTFQLHTLYKVYLFFYGQ